MTPLSTFSQDDVDPLNTHYNRLYSCKHFRNRVLRVQQLCIESSVDAILIMTGKLRFNFNNVATLGMDSRNDNEMRKLLNWLVWGYSCSDIFGEAHSDLFDDSFFVVGKDNLQIYTNQ